MMESLKDSHRLAQLLKALEAGWEIDEPVLIGATWRTGSEGSGSYHFVLRQKTADQTTLLSLPPSAELLDFLAENRIRITTLAS